MAGILFSILLSILPPCATEDSSNCAWNAADRGNGYGRSFIDIGGALIVDPRAN